MPDPSFVFAQALSGLTAAMFLFLIASGLSLIFGVLRVLNFAHGTFYMLGAYCAFQFVQWIGTGPGSFWLAALGAALAVAVARRHRGALPLPPPLRQGRALPAPLHLRARPHPERRGQDLLGHAAEVGEPAARAHRRVLALRGHHPLLQPVHPPARARSSRSPSGSCSSARAWGASSAPPRSTARRWARSASTSTRLYTGVFVLASFLGGLGGALVTPVRDDRARHGHRDHRGGVRRGGDRRARLLLGHVPRRARSTARCSPSASCSSRASRSSRCSP